MPSFAMKRLPLHKTMYIVFGLVLPDPVDSRTYIRLIVTVVVCACDHTHIFKQFLVLIVSREDQSTLSYRNTPVQLQAGC